MVSDSFLRRAFIGEAFLNMTTIPIITHPRVILPLLLRRGIADVNPSTILFARLISALFMATLTPALLFAGYGTSQQAKAARGPTYVMLGLGELAFIPLLMLEIWNGQNGFVKDTAITPRAALVAIMSLAPLCLWRGYVLYSRPDLFGGSKVKSS